MRIAIDAMGGDHGPGPVVEGALPARSRCPADLVLVGNEMVVREALGPRPGGTIPGVIDAPQSITMEESGPLAIRRKREASVNVYRAGVLQGYQGSSSRFSAYKTLRVEFRR
ncbi:MAG: hypothetical protein AB9866_08870 [Syntrophobacteraceae bacterium]